MISICMYTYRYTCILIMNLKTPRQHSWHCKGLYQNFLTLSLSKREKISRWRRFNVHEWASRDTVEFAILLLRIWMNNGNDSSKLVQETHCLGTSYFICFLDQFGEINILLCHDSNTDFMIPSVRWGTVTYVRDCTLNDTCGSCVCLRCASFVYIVMCLRVHCGSLFPILATW